MSDENLNELLVKRAPKPRSKLTTALAAILVLLVGVFIGAAIGKGASSSSTPPGFPAPVITDQAGGGGGAGQGAGQGPGAMGGFPGGGKPVRGTVDSIEGGTITVTTDDAGELASGDSVIVIAPPAGGMPAPSGAPAVSP